MPKMQPDITARIELYPTTAGGRRGKTPPDHLGCIFVFEGQNFECRLLLQETGALKPGAKALVPIRFLSPGSIKTRLKIGDRFELRENRPIGSGLVESVVQSSNR